MDLTGAGLFVKALQEEQVDTIFAYPGGQVIDLFDALYGVKGMYVKITSCTEADMVGIDRITRVFAVQLTDYDTGTALLECLQTEQNNNDLIRLLAKKYRGRIEIVRGGAVAIEAINVCVR